MKRKGGPTYLSPTNESDIRGSVGCWENIVLCKISLSKADPKQDADNLRGSEQLSFIECQILWYRHNAKRQLEYNTLSSLAVVVENTYSVSRASSFCGLWHWIPCSCRCDGSADRLKAMTWLFRELRCPSFFVKAVLSQSKGTA